MRVRRVCAVRAFDARPGLRRLEEPRVTELKHPENRTGFYPKPLLAVAVWLKRVLPTSGTLHPTGEARCALAAPVGNARSASNHGWC